MMRYDVLLSCPSDIQHLLQDIAVAIEDVNHIFESDGFYFQLKNWRKDVLIGYGTPQAIINNQIVDDTDAVIALFGSTLGTPTTKHESATIEELTVVAERHGQVFVFFPKQFSANITQKELKRFNKYKKYFASRGLYKDYNFDDFQEQVKSQLVLYGNKLKAQFINRIASRTNSLIANANKNLDNMHELISQAKNISLLFNTGNKFLLDYESAITKAITDRNCIVKILIADNRNIIFEHKELCNALCPKSTPILAELEQSRAIVKDIIKKSLNTEKGYITLKRFRFMPTCSIIIIDNIVKFTPYIPNIHSRDSVAFFGDITSNVSIYSGFRNAFEESWESIHEYDLTSRLS